jgi:UDP-N-acetylglucosamine enolpyruvyl transferase
MEECVIEEDRPFPGEVTPAGNRTLLLPSLAAALLTDWRRHPHNVPVIGDVRTMLQLLSELESLLIRR